MPFLRLSSLWTYGAFCIISSGRAFPIPIPGPASGCGSRRCMRRLTRFLSLLSSRRSITSVTQLPVVSCWALGGETNNVTFLIRLYARNTARSCACLAFKAKKRFARANPLTGPFSMRMRINSYCLRHSPAAARLTIWGDGVCWVLGAT